MNNFYQWLEKQNTDVATLSEQDIEYYKGLWEQNSYNLNKGN